MGLFDGTPLERPVVCEHCGQVAEVCRCVEADAPPPDIAPESQPLRIRLEKRPRGKFATVVSGFRCARPQLLQVLTELKNRCGSGGSLSETTLEIQGDHVQRVRQLLADMRYRV